MIRIRDKAGCCGCAACANACPRGCISMEADEEGFPYPSVNRDRCVGCGLCERACPVLNQRKEIPVEQRAYLVQNRDERVRRESTSGGAFTAIALEIIRRGGVVFGAAFDGEFRVRHQRAETERGLKKFRNSKYVQSEIGDSFGEAERFLEEGRPVCFSGTPCQIEGLKAFLGKEHENLLTVDVVCHAVPSPLVWKRYIELKVGQIKDRPKNFVFRDKSSFGYQYSTMAIYSDRKEPVYTSGVESDPMLRAFFSNICDRPSCYRCPFKKRYRVSDLTVWDCFGASKLAPGLNDNTGVSSILIQSEKGQCVFDQIRPFLNDSELSPDVLTASSYEMFYPVDGNPRREEFLRDARMLDGRALFTKYFPATARSKLERLVRITACKFGFYQRLKEMRRFLIGGNGR